MKPRGRPILLLFLCAAVSVAGGELGPREPAWPAPELDLPDLAGERHRLDAYRGQVVLVNFWATWCPPCLAEMPSMQRLSEAMQGRPFRILAVNVEESRAKVWKFKKLLNVSFTTLLDSEGEAARSWEVELFPSSYVIDPQGRVRHVVRGSLTWDDPRVVRQLEALMADAPPGDTVALQR